MRYCQLIFRCMFIYLVSDSLFCFKLIQHELEFVFLKAFIHWQELKSGSIKLGLFSCTIVNILYILDTRLYFLIILKYKTFQKNYDVNLLKTAEYKKIFISCLLNGLDLLKLQGGIDCKIGLRVSKKFTFAALMILVASSVIA